MARRGIGGVGPVIRRALTRAALRVAVKVARPAPPPALPVFAMGMAFINPLGLAAGFDDDGTLLAALALSGFGSIEIGTVRTPTMLRAALAHIGRHPRHARIGINLAATATGDAGETAERWRTLMGLTWDAADYLVANLSGSRGAPGRAESLTAQAAMIGAIHGSLARTRGSHTPLAVKFALEHVPAGTLGSLGGCGVDAVIGVSADRDLISRAVRDLAPLPLISVGGIRDGEDVATRLAAGAALVQIHTAFCRRGPFFPRRLLANLATGTMPRGGG